MNTFLNSLFFLFTAFLTEEQCVETHEKECEGWRSWGRLTYLPKVSLLPGSCPDVQASPATLPEPPSQSQCQTVYWLGGHSLMSCNCYYLNPAPFRKLIRQGGGGIATEVVQ